MMSLHDSDPILVILISNVTFYIIQNIINMYNIMYTLTLKEYISSERKY